MHISFFFFSLYLELRTGPREHEQAKQITRGCYHGALLFVPPTPSLVWPEVILQLRLVSLVLTVYG